MYLENDALIDELIEYLDIQLNYLSNSENKVDVQYRDKMYDDVLKILSKDSNLLKKFNLRFEPFLFSKKYQCIDIIKTLLIVLKEYEN